MSKILLIRVFLKFLLISVTTLSSIAHAQNSALYLDKKGLFDRKDDFMYLGLSIGYLENTKFLKEHEKRSLKELQDRIATIKQKYKSQPMNEMWQNFYDNKYQEGANQTKAIDVSIEADLKNRDTSDGTPVLLDPYTCTTYRENRKTGVKHSYNSTYVQDINEKIKSARKNLHALENYLPKSKNSGIMMLTQEDYNKIEGESVFCIPRDGSPNPDLAKEVEAREMVLSAPPRERALTFLSRLISN